MLTEGTKLVVGFGRTNNYSNTESFIADYLAIIEENDLAIVATWLFDNAKRMDKSIFFDPKADWNAMEPVHILTLRTMTPSGVFDATSEAGYLTKVGGNPELSKLSSYIFKDDYDFATNLPEDLGAQLIQLMQIVYRKDIRKADSRVKSM